MRRGESLLVSQPGQDGQGGEVEHGGHGGESKQCGDLSISLLTPPQVVKLTISGDTFTFLYIQFW